MRERVITGLILTVIFIITTWIGGYVFEISMLIFTILGIYELTKMFSEKKEIEYFSFILNTLYAVAMYVSCFIFDMKNIHYIMTLYLAILFFTYVINSKENLGKMLKTMLVGMYVVLGFHYMMELNGTYLVWLIYILSFMTDIFAYFVGRAFGKHKLCPTISPNKTIEGAVGGLIGALIIASLYFGFIGEPISISTCIFFIIVSIFSMFGDLFASKMKREYGIKDYGKIFPGHGGVMDRFDSLLFVAIAIHLFEAIV